MARSGDKLRAYYYKGFAVPALYEYCENEGIRYTIGLISNPRLEALAEDSLEEAQERYEAQKEKVRLLSEGYFVACCGLLVVGRLENEAA